MGNLNYRCFRVHFPPKGRNAVKTRYTVASAMLAGVALGSAAVQGLHAQAKPPAYYIASVTVSNPTAYLKEFAAQSQALVKAAGGRYLVLGGKITPLSGKPLKSRFVVARFDSMEQLQAWWDSAKNKDLRKIGVKYATFDAFAVEGRPQ